MPWWVLIVYVSASAVTFVAYGWDKRQARLGRRRIPERVLHAFELVGGWPGAFAGMTFFRHKRRKLPFLIVVWSIAALHAAAWLLTFLRE